MPEKFKGKYRSETTRLKSWDYGWNGAYFVTICTKDRQHFFGKISNQEMYLSDIGIFAVQCWKQISNHFPFVKLGEFIVMPNHIHGIIIIDKKDDNRLSSSHVETQNFASLRASKQNSLNEFGPQSKNLGSIIRGFKIGVTKSTKKINPNFKWQTRYYDHIIKDQDSFDKISEYIIMNPKNWEKDKYY